MRRVRRLTTSIVISFCALWAMANLARLPTVAAQQIEPNGITAPAAEDIIAGVVLVQGTADHPEFLRYELSFYQEFNQYAGWIVFAEGDQPVISGTLAVWDTTVGQATNAPVFPDGEYRLRLRVVRRDYNYDEFFSLGIIVSNNTPTPTPSITPTATIDPNATPVITVTPNLGDAQTSETSENTVAALPTLTPFPTPSPPAIPTPPTAIGENGADSPAGQNTGQPPDEDPIRAVAEQVGQINTGQLLTAAQLGVRITLALFGLLAAYLILRMVGRYIWLRFVSQNNGAADQHKRK